MTKLTLHNFKAFKDLEIDIFPLTVLSGLNGTGKSTTLQALALLRQSRDANFLDVRGFLLNGELLELGVGSDVLFDQHDDEVIRIGLSLGETAFQWEALYEADGDVLYFGVPPKHGFYAGTFSGGLFGSGFQYLKADRLGPNVSYPKSHYQVSERRFLGTRGEYTAHYLHLFRDDLVDEAMRHHSDVGPSLLSQTNAWMAEFSPGMLLDVDEILRTDTVRLDFQYGGTGGISSTNLFRSTNVGFGLTYALPIVVACLGMPRGAWIMVENPEAHLHPRGQAKIGELLARVAARGTTVILETHSDHVMNGIRIAVKEGIVPSDSVGLHFFSRSPGVLEPKHSQPRISPEGRMSTWPDGFFDQWDKALDRLLD